MHRTDGANNVSGLFKDSPTPGTTVEHFWLNAIQEEAANAILASRQALFASGALDAAASPPYQQLLKAIHRLGHGYFNFVSVPTDGTGLDTTFNQDILAYSLDPDVSGDTPFRHVLLPYSTTSVFGSVPNAHGYAILVVNNTPSIKILEDSVRHVNFRIMSGQACLMYGWNDTGTRIVWNQIGSETTNAETSTPLHGDTSGTNVGSVMVNSVYTYVAGKHISITVKQIEVFSIPTGGEVRLSFTPGPDVTLPLGGLGLTQLIQIIVGITYEVGRAVLNDGGTMVIERLVGGGFDAGSHITIRPFSVSCSLS